ncbi:MAG: DUF3291 domain-containing protein [Leptospiraceae bacterium]|nr:DUF3291 domain-containing protein [Leptospiraceae bacterium]MCB1317116.1 DUF3291 domain-containing protein [Leptospiraceae bacterium]
MSLSHHLAEFNISRMIAPLEDPRMAEFVARIDRVNAIADAAPGFVWRMQTSDGDSLGIRAYDDERMLVNLSVWQNIEVLFDYVYRSEHQESMRLRRQWFEPMIMDSMVMWWVPYGHIPDIMEAKMKLELLRSVGPQPEAFSPRRLFDPNGRPLRLRQGTVVHVDTDPGYPINTD